MHFCDGKAELFPLGENGFKKWKQQPDRTTTAKSPLN
jgi:hypothetical protein